MPRSALSRCSSSTLFHLSPEKEMLQDTIAQKELQRYWASQAVLPKEPLDFLLDPDLIHESERYRLYQEVCSGERDLEIYLKPLVLNHFSHYIKMMGAEIMTREDFNRAACEMFSTTTEIYRHYQAIALKGFIFKLIDKLLALPDDNNRKEHITHLRTLVSKALSFELVNGDFSSFYVLFSDDDYDDSDGLLNRNEKIKNHNENIETIVRALSEKLSSELKYGEIGQPGLLALVGMYCQRLNKGLSDEHHLLANIARKEFSTNGRDRSRSIDGLLGTIKRAGLSACGKDETRDLGQLLFSSDSEESDVDGIFNIEGDFSEKSIAEVLKGKRKSLELVGKNLEKKMANVVFSMAKAIEETVGKYLTEETQLCLFQSVMHEGLFGLRGAVKQMMQAGSFSSRGGFSQQYSGTIEEFSSKFPQKAQAILGNIGVDASRIPDVESLGAIISSSLRDDSNVLIQRKNDMLKVMTAFGFDVADPIVATVCEQTVLFHHCRDSFSSYVYLLTASDALVRTAFSQKLDKEYSLEAYRFVMSQVSKDCKLDFDGICKLASAFDPGASLDKTIKFSEEELSFMIPKTPVSPRENQPTLSQPRRAASSPRRSPRRSLPILSSSFPSMPHIPHSPRECFSLLTRRGSDSSSGSIFEQRQARAVHQPLSVTCLSMLDSFSEKQEHRDAFIKLKHALQRCQTDADVRNFQRGRLQSHIKKEPHVGRMQFLMQLSERIGRHLEPLSVEQDPLHLPRANLQNGYA